LLWVEVGVHAVRKRPLSVFRFKNSKRPILRSECAGVAWAGAGVAWRLCVCCL
jgi:hypothetical protein